MSTSAKTGRRVRDETEAAALLCEWESSGERISDWCRARGISWYSLNAYQGRRVARSEEPEMVELTLGQAFYENNRDEQPRYLVRINGVEVVVEDDFREDTLRRLLQVVTC